MLVLSHIPIRRLRSKNAWSSVVKWRVLHCSVRTNNLNTLLSVLLVLYHACITPRNHMNRLAREEEKKRPFNKVPQRMTQLLTNHTKYAENQRNRNAAQPQTSWIHIVQCTADMPIQKQAYRAPNPEPLICRVLRCRFRTVLRCSSFL